jgi:uncharacterized peroxidase-related enzyme
MNHHGEALQRLVKDGVWVHALAENYRQVELSNAERAMLDFAEKLARRPEDVRYADHMRLREVGFDDRAILDINQIIAYFSFVNRMALGLDVQLESYWESGEFDLLGQDIRGERNE